MPSASASKVPTEEPRRVPPWHVMSKEECFKELEVPADIRKKGLTAAQAAERLEKYGENKLTEKEKETLLQKIWKQVNNVLVGILVFVAIISAASAISKIGNVLTSWIQVAIIFSVIA
jgi:magnesium-transporting ATPase (P-type)